MFLFTLNSSKIAKRITAHTVASIVGEVAKKLMFESAANA